MTKRFHSSIKSAFISFSFILWATFCSANDRCSGLLMNAEAFGFGPSAATAQLLPELRSGVKRIGYIGEGHTLGLQENLPYDDIVKLNEAASEAEVREQLRRLSTRYSHFYTSLDFRYARIAQEEGFKVAVYDPLTWFWKPFPEGVKNFDLYVAQDFVGVKDRIVIERTALPAKTEIISPIVRPLNRRSMEQRDQASLINLGGLSNPFVSNELMFKFAELLARSCQQAIGVQVSDVVVATNTKFARAMPKYLNASTLNPEQIQNNLERVRTVFMTSGLGNLIEASSAGTPVVWLPPTNDSQGQQIQLLKRKNMVDWSVDWTDFTDGPPIDYFQPQEIVMNEIKTRMAAVLENPAYQVRLAQALREKTQNSFKTNQTLRINRLVDEYGQGGIKDLARIVKEWVDHYE